VRKVGSNRWRVRENRRSNKYFAANYRKEDDLMSNIQKGAEALGALNATNEGGAGGEGVKFTSFKSGTSIKVAVPSADALIRFYSYGAYKSVINGAKVHTFVAKNPSVKNPKGFPVENLTAWDQAFKYYQDLKFAARDNGNAEEEEKLGNLAYQFKPKERYAFAFYDLSEKGKPMFIDISKNQAQVIHGVIKKFEKKLGKVAFELSKQGSGKNTTVSLTPFIDMDEDLNDKEREAFAKVIGEEFDMTLFDGLLYEADEKEQLNNLAVAGFDLALIGADKPAEEIGDVVDDLTDQF
jgi:hypothetical protein